MFSYDLKQTNQLQKDDTEETLGHSRRELHAFFEILYWIWSLLMKT